MLHSNHTISQGRTRWIDLINPTSEELAALQAEFGFHELDMEDCATENQRPKVDEYDRYIFLVLHVPVVKSTGRIRAAEVDVFIASNLIVTIHYADIEPIARLRRACEESEEARVEHLGRGAGYFLYVLTNDIFGSCFPIVDRLWRTANRLERDVFDNDAPRDLVKDIMTFKRNVITCRRILQSERTVVPALEHKNKKFLPANLEVYFDDVVDKVEKIWSSLESLKEVGDTLQDANEAIIGHRAGNTIRVLTVFSVILLPLTLITGLFGMNVPIPHAGEPLAFWVIAASMGGIVSGLVVFFRSRGWL